MKKVISIRAPFTLCRIVCCCLYWEQKKNRKKGRRNSLVKADVILLFLILLHLLILSAWTEHVASTVWHAAGWILVDFYRRQKDIVSAAALFPSRSHLFKAKVLSWTCSSEITLSISVHTFSSCSFYMAINALLFQVIVSPFFHSIWGGTLWGHSLCCLSNVHMRCCQGWEGRGAKR